jgi:hypothetical protein
MSRTIIIAFALLAACRSERSAPPAHTQTATPAPLANATQDALRAELEDAQRLGTYRQVRTRWQGQRLHWSVTRYRALCASADACNVAAFPVQRPARQGWLPQLGFAPGAFDALSAACGDRDVCQLTIDGTLADLDATGEHATKVRIDGVTVVKGA